MSDFRARLTANAEEFDTIISEVLAENEALKARQFEFGMAVADAMYENHHNIDFREDQENIDRSVITPLQRENNLG